MRGREPSAGNRKFPSFGSIDNYFFWRRFLTAAAAGWTRKSRFTLHARRRRGNAEPLPHAVCHCCSCQCHFFLVPNDIVTRLICLRDINDKTRLAPMLFLRCVGVLINGTSTIIIIKKSACFINPEFANLVSSLCMYYFKAI